MSMIRTARRRASLAAALMAGLGTGAGGGASATAAQAPSQGSLFEWSMPARYGVERDAHGVISETDPAHVGRGPWPVRLQISPALCAPGGTYRWYLGTHLLRVRPLPGCAFSARLPRERSYPVRLELRTGGSARRSETQSIVVNDLLIVSIGDSVGSGEAVPDLPGLLRARWKNPRCHRSARASPAQAAERIEADDQHTSVTFVHLACSGATIPDGVLGTYDGAERSTPPLPAQINGLEQVTRQRTVDAVIVNVGANDVSFGDIVRACAAHLLAHNCFEEPLRGGGPPIRDVVQQELRELPGRYAQLAEGLREARVPPGRVHIVQYFDPTRDTQGNTCPRILGAITGNELREAQTEVLAPLNRAIAQAAHLHRWHLVAGAPQAFSTHGYCAAEPWVTSMGRSLAFLGGRLDQRLLGTLHPNEPGQEAIAALLAGSLERRLLPGQTPPALAGLPAPAQSELSLLAVALIALSAAILVLAAGALGWRLRRPLESVGAALALALAALLLAGAARLRDSEAVAAALAAAGGGAVAVAILLRRLKRADPG
jgi:lysophospholipase L1-like esterase